MSMTSSAQFSAANGRAETACLLEMFGVTGADTSTIVNDGNLTDILQPLRMIPVAHTSIAAACTALPPRSMVGHVALNHGIGVRIPGRQPGFPPRLDLRIEYS